MNKKEAHSESSEELKGDQGLRQMKSKSWYLSKKSDKVKREL